MITRFGKYDLLALLATGGMAEIWLARIAGVSGVEKLVVIKRLLEALAADPEHLEMFLDEARINARLSHPNVVQVLELGQVEGKYFMAMEYVPGLSAAQVGRRAAQRLGEVPQHVACGIVLQACAGLHYAHEHALPDGTPLDIIHRDVSPQNLILTFDGVVKVVDFGIARAAGRMHRTAAGLVKGKRSYMAPEQCLGLALDRRADVFALGIVLFELCTARRLFKRATPYATLTAITSGDIPPPRTLSSKIDPAVEAVIMKALATEKKRRFASAGQMQEALEEAMAGAGLRGTAADLERFATATFADEMVEQRRLLVQALQGTLAGIDPAAVSAIAERALSDRPGAALDGDGDGVSDDKTSIDALPLLGDDSARTPALAELAAGVNALPGGGGDTVPDGVPAFADRTRLLPRYYRFALFGVLVLAAALVWLLAFRR